MTNYSPTESLDIELSRALGLQDYAKRTFERSEADRSLRTIISGKYYHLAYEHAASLLLLIGAGHRGSALAIYRPAYEALLRGVWAGYGATDCDLAAIDARTYSFPGNGALARKIENSAPKVLRGMINVMHSVLPEKVRHDLTHGGILQLVHRFDGKTIGTHVPDEIVIPFIRAASTIMAGSSVGIALTPGNPVDFKEVLATFISVFAKNDSEVARLVDKALDYEA